MSYGDQIRRLKLVQAISKAEGRDDLSQSDIEQLHAMVIGVADKVGDLLAAIPMTFRQYTKHDLLHARNLIDLMGRFIPAKTLKKLNAVELTVLALVSMLHDFGMYVEEGEKERILDDDEFLKLLEAMPEKKQAIEEAEAAGKRYAVAAIRDAVLADYFRKLHPERARENIRKYLTGALQFREHDLAEDIANICESHGWGVFEATDPRHAERTIERLKTSDPIYGVPFNPQYVAMCLRLADIMDFDRSRTPLALLKTITDAKSQSEWLKHLAIRGWTINERDIAFHARCKHPEHYVAVMEFLDWIDVELRDCRRLLRTSQAPYALNLSSSVDRFEVEMADPNYLAGAFRFELDYERIMKLLMDRSLYPDPSLFLRELLQNSLDACRVRLAMAQSEDATASYTPRITVWNDNTTIVIQDNGIGMSKSVIEKYFMRIGRSYYRSTEFEIERKRLLAAGIELEATSQFGIGFLSCFMVADRIEIETYNDRSQPLRIVIEGPTKYFTIEKLPQPERPHFRVQGSTPEEDRPPTYVGTRITVQLRPRTEVKVREVLKQFAVNVEVPITIVERVGAEEIPLLRWERRDPTLADIGLSFSSDVEGLLDIVMPWYVPLEQYEFCEGIRGKLWFWMLRDANGNPSPKVGHLEITGSLCVADPIRTYSEVVFNTTRAVRAKLSQRGLPNPGAGSTVVEHFNELWKNASKRERAQVADWFTKDASADDYYGRYWYGTPGSGAALAAGDDSWMAIPTKMFHEDLGLDGPEEFALHGIILPAGITKWNPMAGEASKLTLFHRFGAGCRLDLRRSAPTPAANRLFIDPIEGRKIAVPVFRALLHVLLEVIERDGDDSRWVSWAERILNRFSFRRVVDEYDYVKSAILAERQLLRRVLRLRLVISGELVKWTVSEARNHFGRWLPIGRDQSDGIVAYSSINTLLLFGHPTRSDPWAVDLDTSDSSSSWRFL